MSDQNSTTPDPSEAVPGYQPPASSNPAASAVPPAPAFEPPMFQPPAVPGGYPPPAYPPPPAAGPYAGPYTAPGAGGYNQPPTPGYPEPSGYPPAQSYGQQPGYFPPPGAPMVPMGPVGRATLVDWPKRALGGVIDYVAAGVVISIIGSVLSNMSTGLGSAANAVLGIGWMLYLGHKSGTTGVTFGRSIAKTKLVSEETGAPIGSMNGIIRQLAHIVDSIICYIGWLFPLWDAKRQTLADKIMKTVVVDNSQDPNAGTYNWNL
ncbi:MAG: RDD family protein [Propionicimonas sp.]